MSLVEEFNKLQRLFAQEDLLNESLPSSGTGFMKILLAKRKNMKIKIYQEKGHTLPHFHIDYGGQHHTASYAIESGERIEGDLSKKYDRDVSIWLKRNRDKLLEIWKSLQTGVPHEHILAELAGDL